MTKLDGTAKGGILLAVGRKFKLPIIALGMGEKEDDLQIFDAQHYANGIICLLYTSPSPRDGLLSRMPSSA